MPQTHGVKQEVLIAWELVTVATEAQLRDWFVKVGKAQSRFYVILKLHGWKTDLILKTEEALGNHYHLVLIVTDWIKLYLQKTGCIPGSSEEASGSKWCCLRMLSNSFLERPLASGAGGTAMCDLQCSIGGTGDASCTVTCRAPGSTLRYKSWHFLIINFKESQIKKYGQKLFSCKL